MYKNLKYILIACCLSVVSMAKAQVTVQSPYSKFGVGNLKGTTLPQFRGMGGIAAAVSKNSFFNNINVQNPATYATMDATSIDIGVSGSFKTIRSSQLSQHDFNGSLNHVALAFNLGRRAGLSFGILPYSELGYDFKNAGVLGDATDNKRDVNYLYRGEGGLTKAYLGYGIGIGDYFRVGANVEYLFGNLSETRSTEFVNDPGALSARIQDENSIGGFTYSYGAQYDIRIDSKTSLVLGYSGSARKSVNSTRTNYVTHYTLDMDGNENSAIDTLFSVEKGKTSLIMPTQHQLGIVLQKNDHWLFGAEYRMGKWSDLNIAQVNQQLQDTYGFSVGGQFVPDHSAINGYFKRVEYRFGFQYDKTYIRMSNNDIKQTSVTLGLGLPMATYARGTFYKANVTAEIGKRGTVAGGLLQERFINIHLGFTLNDASWGKRYRLD